MRTKSTLKRSFEASTLTAEPDQGLNLIKRRRIIHKISGAIVKRARASTESAEEPPIKMRFPNPFYVGATSSKEAVSDGSTIQHELIDLTKESDDMGCGDQQTVDPTEQNMESPEVSISNTPSSRDIVSQKSAESDDSRVLATSGRPSMDMVVDHEEIVDGGSLEIEAEEEVTTSVEKEEEEEEASTSAEEAEEPSNVVEHPVCRRTMSKSEVEAYVQAPESTKRWYGAPPTAMTADEMKEFMDWANKMPLSGRVQLRINPVNWPAYIALDRRNQKFVENWRKHLRIVLEAAVNHINMAMFAQLKINFLGHNEGRNMFLTCNVATGMEMSPYTINGNPIPVWFPGDMKKKPTDLPGVREQRLFNEALLYAGVGNLLYRDFTETLHQLTERLMAGNGVIPYTARHKAIAMALSASTKKFFGIQRGIPATLPRNLVFKVEEIEVDREEEMEEIDIMMVDEVAPNAPGYAEEVVDEENIDIIN